MRAPVALVLALILATALAVAAAGAAAGPASAVSPLSATLQATFTGQATQTLCDQLGTAVAVSGDTALVGAQYFQDTTKAPAPYHTGEVYVYVRSAGAWQQQAVLRPPSDMDASYFGYSVAIDGDTAVVGAYGHLYTAGSVYVYTRSGGVWSLQQELDGTVHSELGWSVAISGDTLLAGAPAYYADPSPVATGAARVYTRAGGAWTLQQQFVAGDGADSDRFGWSVGLDGDSAVVGAPFKDGGSLNGAGAAYVFARSAGAWSQRLELAGAAGANLGRSVALSGQTALAGAPASYNATGSVAVLQNTGGTWAKQTELGSAGSVPGDRLGFSVALDGDQAVIGAAERATTGVSFSGSVYAFGRSGGVWAQQARIDPPTPTTMMHFGYAVAVDGTTVLAGEPAANNYYAGHAYAYLLTSGASADTTPPVTTAQVSPAGWTNKPVTVTLSASDDFSGVSLTQYKVAGAAGWQTYTAPFQCTAPGVVAYVCRSTDGAAIPNVEPDVSFTVYRDLVGPATQALANVTAKAGKRASFRFKVTDVTPSATVSLKVFKGKRVKKTVKVGSRPTGSTQSYSWTCSLPRGTYTWKVYATDQAGNAQVKMTGKALTVK